MSFDAVTSIVDFLKVFKRVQLSLYDEARKVESEFTRIQATRNKREPLSNRGYRIPTIKHSGTVKCHWNRRNIIASGKYTTNRYKCPKSNTYSIRRVTSGSPEWEIKLLTEAEYKFTEIRKISNSVKSVEKSLNTLIEKVNNVELELDYKPIIPDDQGTTEEFALMASNYTHEYVADVLNKLHARAVRIQDEYYENWMHNAAVHARSITGRFPSIRMNKNSLEIRWIKRTKIEDSAVITSYKKGGSGSYNVHKMTTGLPAWVSDLVGNAESNFNLVRIAAKSVHGVRRSTRELITTINSTSRIDTIQM